MELRELNSEQCQRVLSPALVPQGASTGRPRADDRRTLNGILYVFWSVAVAG